MTGDKLKTEITAEMVLNAGKFGNDYFQNPAKTIKDRTGEKERGYGQIMSDKIYGKVIENGVAGALHNFCKQKKFIADNVVRTKFDYSQPDLIGVIDIPSKEERDPNKFVEIKFSPSNFVVLSILQGQWDGIRAHGNLDDVVIIYASLVDKFCNDLNAMESDNGQTLDYLTDDEKRIMKGVKKEIEFLKNLRADHPDLRRINFRDTPTCELIVDKNKLEEWKEYVKESRKDTDDAINELEKELKSLGQTLKSRKLDFYGMYQKLKRDTLGYSDDPLNFFLGFDSLRVRIDLIITGTEFEEHARLFEKGDFIYNPKIIRPATDPFDDSGKLKPDQNSLKREPLGETNSKDEIIQIPTDVYVESFGETNNARTNPENQIRYPPQFGDLTCKGQVRLVREHKINPKSEKETIIICCDSDGEIESDFLGKFPLTKGNCYRIEIENRLGGKDTKNANDMFASKGKIEQLYGEQTVERAKKLAEEL